MNDRTDSSGAAPEEQDSVIVRFAGDSGDGMQLTGARFTEAHALAGNDVATLPDYPAEIRAPAGTVGGVSGFQVQFADHRVFTPGDQPDVLVAMNPAALLRNLKDLPTGGTIVLDEDSFTTRAIAKAGFEQDPRQDGTLDAFKVFEVPISKATLRALDDIDLTKREKERSRNFFALGLAFWMFERPLDATLAWVTAKFGESTPTGRANGTALQKGYDFGVTAEIAPSRVLVPPAAIPEGHYRSITGNAAIALGVATVAHLAKRPVVYAGYPITPASDILHELARLKAHGIETIQAEDEIAACCMAIGASYGGALGITASSGPGIVLKGEAIGLATATELPLVIINVQRAGPSTGMPTKPEQSDLELALFGRNGESPCVVLAPRSPSDCYDMAIEAFRMAVRHMVPVFLMSDAYLANSAEPWLIPLADELEPIVVPDPGAAEDFSPVRRHPETLARTWAHPGMAGFEHRIGGIEKDEHTGNISYDPDNHARMTELRREKVEAAAKWIAPLEAEGDPSAELLIVSWGSTWGAIHTAVIEANRRGIPVAHAHFRHLNPMPSNTAELLERYPRILVPELNDGQLARVLRARFGVSAEPMPKVQGRPFTVRDILGLIHDAGVTA